jgi:hypothetical protein
VPARSDRLLRPVERFVEKPAEEMADELFAAGALWNSFLFAAPGATLVRLFEERLPELTASFARVFAEGASDRAKRLEALYAELDTHDFSRDVLQANERHLRLEIVPLCGWTDLGTPARVEACLAALGEDPVARRRCTLPAVARSSTSRSPYAGSPRSAPEHRPRRPESARIVERAVILTSGDTHDLDATPLPSAAAGVLQPASPRSGAKLESVEHEHSWSRDLPDAELHSSRPAISRSTCLQREIERFPGSTGPQAENAVLQLTPGPWKP